MECGTNVNSCRSSGCCSFCGLYWFYDWRNDFDSWWKTENIRKYRDLQRRGQNREALCLVKAHCNHLFKLLPPVKMLPPVKVSVANAAATTDPGTDVF